MGENYNAEEDFDLAEAPLASTAAVVPESLAGLRMDIALAKLFPQYSRNRLQVWLKSGHVLVDGEQLEASARTMGGEKIELAAPPAADVATPRAQRMALAIVFEDADLIVVDKPVGLIVHPGAGNPDRTLLNGLLAHSSALRNVPRAGIVHRLDKDTSGLMVVAKTDAAHAHLSAQWHARTVERQYLALAWGVPSPRAGTISGAIRRSARVRTKMAVVQRGGRASATRYRLQRALRDVASVVECRLATGRTHQVRVHLAHIGHPVIGDPVYGGGLTAARRRAAGDAAATLITALHRQALHAATLGFVHPTSGAVLSFTSALPVQLVAGAGALELQ